MARLGNVKKLEPTDPQAVVTTDPTTAMVFWQAFEISISEIEASAGSPAKGADPLAIEKTSHL